VSPALRISVVVPSFERHDSMERLLLQLAKQELAPDAMEVVVVDDGSKTDPSGRFRALPLPYPLTVIRQANAGAAAARHRGVLEARAPVVLFLDDDMQVGPGVVAAHLAIHDRDPKAVVLGRITPDPAMAFDLFERFHARVLERFADDVRAGRVRIRGTNVYTGNLSLRRDAYLRVGGFDHSFGHSEDAELGVRLEKDGASFYVTEEGGSIHSSDRASLEGWRRRSKKYGVFDTRIAKKHPDVPDADPWRYFRSLSRLSRPVLAASVVAPSAAEKVATAVLRVAYALDGVGLERVALAGTTLAYGIEYARGMREEAGTLAGAACGWADYTAKVGPRSAGERAAMAAVRAARDVAEDHRTMRRYDEKYGGAERSSGDLPKDAVRRIGFQMMVAIRAMQFFRDAGMTPLAMVTSRLVRHAYGSDVHWDAHFDPGVMIVHGMGLCISGKARVASDVILFQHVTLGESVHPETRIGGAPILGRGVHVGAGATLIGPITVGEGSKIMAGCVVRESIPADSVVTAPEPAVAPRVSARKRTGGRGA
jgi:serine acetyltransferase/GT2 family glycosyltransferase